MHSRSINRARENPGAKYSGSLTRRMLINEVPGVVGLPSVLDSGAPSAFLGVPPDSTIGRFCLLVGRLVLNVFSLGHDAQIGTATIERISVDMISDTEIARFEIQDHAVQVDGGAFTRRKSDASRCVFTTSAYRPAPLVDPRSISSINDSVCSDAAISGAERDQDGILGLHREASLPGVTPPAGNNCAGASCCLNYTRSLREGVV